MLLDWLARRSGDAALGDCAHRIETAVETALANPETRTRDIGGTLDTRAFTAAVIAAL